MSVEHHTHPAAEWLSEPEQGALQDVAERLGITLLSDEAQAEVAQLANAFIGVATELQGEQIEAYGYFAVSDTLSSIGAPNERNHHLITRGTQEAHRLFSGLLLSAVAEYERTNSVLAERLIEASYEQLMSGSPNIMTYSGGPKELFELLSLSQATPGGRALARPLVGELGYELSYGYHEKDGLQAVFQGRTVNEQLQALGALSSIRQWSEGNGEWAAPAVRKTEAALGYARTTPELPRIVNKMAAAYLETLRADNWYSYIDPAEYERSQQAVAAEFPGLRPYTADGDHSLVKIASDLAAENRGGVLTQAQYRGPFGDNIGRIDTARGAPDLSLSAQECLLLTELHRPMLREAVEADLGVSLVDLPLMAQKQLLSYLASADGETYDAICRHLHEQPEARRGQLAEAFLATEFGSDFGGILMKVVDRFQDQPDQLGELLDRVVTIRSLVPEVVAGKLPAKDQQREVLVRAYAKRIAEQLAVLATEDDTDDTLEALGIIEQVYRCIRDGYRAGFAANSSDDPSFGTFRSQLGGDGALTTTIRLGGDQMRIGDTVTLSRQALPERLRQKDRRISVRLDYEDGGPSLDIASTGPRASAVSRFLAEQIARGEAAMARYQGQQNRENRYHVREVFPADFSEAAFRQLAVRAMYQMRVAPSEQKAAA